MLSCAAIDLGPDQVLAGPNGAGKTTLLDISVLIGDMIRRQLIVAAFLERREAGRAARATTLIDLPYRGVGNTVGFALEAKLPVEVSGELASLSAGTAISGRRLPTHLRYELRLAVTSRALSVSGEYLFLLSEEDSRVPDRVAERYEELPSWLSWADGRARYPAWQPVMVREDNSLARYFPEVETRPTVDVIKLHISQRFAEGWKEFAVIVIEPELETWLMSENKQLATAFRCPENYREILAAAGLWPKGSAKPPDPKEALEYLRRRHRVRVGNAEFGKLAEAMSVRQCQDPAFLQLRDKLREWFPTVRR